MKLFSSLKVAALVLALVPAVAAAEIAPALPYPTTPPATTPQATTPTVPTPRPTAPKPPQAPLPTPAPTPVPVPVEEPTAPLPTFNIPAGYTYAGYGLRDDGTTDVYYNEAAPAEWQSMLPLAEQIWNAKVNCPNGITMLTMTPGSARTGAAATLNGCRIWVSVDNIARNPSFFARCVLVAHEYGHLLGHEHEGHDLLMSEDESIYNVSIPLCGKRAAFEPMPTVGGKPAQETFVPAKLLTFKMAKEMTIDVMSKSWKVTGCKRVNKNKVRCAMRKVETKGKRKGKLGKQKRIVTVTMREQGASYSADYE